jgi:hypothetical protein
MLSVESKIDANELEVWRASRFRELRPLETLVSCLCCFFLSHALTDIEFHLAGFLVGIYDDVVAMQNFSVQYLQRQGVLHQLLYRPLQGTRSEVGVVTLSEQ